MKAVRYIETDRPPELVDLAMPEPGPGQVLIRVAGAGVCRSDSHVLDHGIGISVPLTLGHENAPAGSPPRAPVCRAGKKVIRLPSTGHGALAIAIAARVRPRTIARTTPASTAKAVDWARTAAWPSA